MDEKIPIVLTIASPPKKIQSNKRNDNYVDSYNASLKNQIGSFKSEIIF